jgi:hypothetical protein
VKKKIRCKACNERFILKIIFDRGTTLRIQRLVQDPDDTITVITESCSDKDIEIELDGISCTISESPRPHTVILSSKVLLNHIHLSACNATTVQELIRRLHSCQESPKVHTPLDFHIRLIYLSAEMFY